MEFLLGGTKAIAQNPVAGRVVRLSGIVVDLFTIGRDRAQGRVGPGHEPVFVDKKAIEIGMEKVLGKNPGVGAVMDVLFDGDKANRRGELPPFMNPDGSLRFPLVVLGADEPAPPVQMLPMWNADP